MRLTSPEIGTCAVADPDIQISGMGEGRGDRQSLKNVFWCKNREDQGPPGPSPGSPTALAPGK